MKLVFVISVLLVATTLAFPSKPPQDCYKNQDPDCFCTLQWEPVCGVNGCTYGNPCKLECARVKQAYGGECKTDGSTSY